MYSDRPITCGNPEGSVWVNVKSHFFGNKIQIVVIAHSASDFQQLVLVGKFLNTIKPQRGITVMLSTLKY